MSLLRMFPLMALPALVYTLLIAPAGAGAASSLAQTAFSMHMASGSEWIVTRGHLITMFAVICLFFEVLKSARPSTSALVDNALSVAVFIVCLILFLLIPGFGTTEFFLVLAMAVLDFLAGAVVMVTASRRTVQYDRQS